MNTTKPTAPPCRNRACQHGVLCRSYIAPVLSRAEMEMAHRHQGDGADCPDYEPWRPKEPALMVWVDECPQDEGPPDASGTTMPDAIDALRYYMMAHPEKQARTRAMLGDRTLLGDERNGKGRR